MNQPHLPLYHKPCSLFNKNFNCCTVVIEIYFMFMILCLCSKSIHTRYYYRNDRAILLEEPRKSADLCSSVLLIITRKRLHPDSIQLFRFEFVIRYERKFPICRSLLQCVFALCDTVTLTISPDSHCWTTYRDGLSICQV